VKFEQVAELPKFDTGQYESCEFSMSGGNARLAIHFAELPPFEINFHRARWYQFTALPNCEAELIKDAYFRLVEVVDSRVLSSFIDGDRHQKKPTSSFTTIEYSSTRQVATRSLRSRLPPERWSTPFLSMTRAGGSA